MSMLKFIELDAAINYYISSRMSTINIFFKPFTHEQSP